MPLPSDTFTTGTNHLGFLSGGGEMGYLTRNYNWSNSPVGPVESWPQSLKTAVSIIINSKFPMFLFWGKRLTCFYNDAYRPSLGNDGKHPSALGQPGAEVWPEIWPVIKPLINQVLAGGEATWSEDQLIPIYRNGQLEDVYWTFSYSPVIGESGRPAGVFVTCTETTKTVLSLQKLKLSEQRFRNLIREATVGVVVLMGPEMRIDVVNDMYGRLIDRKPEELLHKNLFDVIPDSEAYFRPLLDKVRITGEPLYLYDTHYAVHKDGDMIEGWINVVYQPYRESDGTISGVIAICQDVSENIESRTQIAESEHRLRNLIENAPFPIGVYTGKELMIQLANQSILDVWGKGNDVIGKLYTDILPELENQEIFSQLHDVLDTGKPFHAQNTPLDLLIDGKLKTFYFNYSFTPLYDSDGNVYGVMNTAADVTELNLAKRRIEESRNNLKSTILQAPVAMCLLRSADYTVEIANERMLEIWGKDADAILGKPIFTGLPEAKNQGFENALDSVFTTGQTFRAYDVPVKLPRNSGIETVYLDFVYEAFTENNEIAGVMAIAIEVTEKVIARKKIEQAEESARLAIESADLGTYMVDLTSDMIQTSDRFNEIWGMDTSLPRNQLAGSIHPDDRIIRKTAHEEAIRTGNLHYEARVMWPDNTEHWIKVKGKVLFDENRKPLTLLGIIQDVTEQKQFAEELTKQVRERTAELQRSNEDLLHFAHVASHDLKEPVRKVKVFSNMLEEEFGDNLPGKAGVYLNKVQHATDRMFSMIDGVLSYSTLNSSDQPIEKVNLNSIIENIKTDLEVIIQNKHASIEHDALPEIEGAGVLIYQLFYNLINNALKFSKTDEKPLISISSFPEQVNGTYFAKIIIADNGIGIDQKYAAQIFNPFTRLNAKDAYEGTGLGLALCKKIVERHHGTISATGIKNEGTVFTVMLPLRQDKKIL